MNTKQRRILKEIMRKHHFQKQRELQIAKEKKSKIFLESRKPEPIPNGMQKFERMRKESLYVGNGKYLREDAGKNTSSKAIVLKVTNPNKKSEPFEHLTYKRVDQII